MSFVTADPARQADAQLRSRLERMHVDVFVLQQPQDPFDE